MNTTINPLIANILQAHFPAIDEELEECSRCGDMVKKPERYFLQDRDWDDYYGGPDTPSSDTYMCKKCYQELKSDCQVEKYFTIIEERI